MGGIQRRSSRHVVVTRQAGGFKSDPEPIRYPSARPVKDSRNDYNSFKSCSLPLKLIPPGYYR